MIVSGNPFSGGDPISQWTTVETIGYWEAIGKKLATNLLLSMVKLPIPDPSQYFYTKRYITWQLFKVYIPFYEVCYDDCTNIEVSREGIGKGETGKTKKVIVKTIDVLSTI
jgi:hypothetical protein